MSELFEYWIPRWKLIRALSKAYKADAAILAKARKEGNSSTALADLSHELDMENWIEEDELSQIESRRLCRTAHRYKVPIPSHQDDTLWEKSTVIGGYQLTTEGFSKLRTDIRKEKNERWQYWELRFKLVVGVATAVTGALGAAIGLLATWGKPPAP